MSAQPTQHDEWVYQRGAALKLKAMLEHQGWKEVLEPMLTSHLNRALNDLENADIRDYNQFLHVRQSVKAIKLVFSYIKGIIAEGENAAEMLEKEKSEEQE